MSLHVDLKPEAIARLARERRQSTISSAVISVLTIALIFLCLGFILLPDLVMETPTFVTYETTSTEENKLEQNKVNLSVLRKPSSPSSSQAQVIASTSASALSIPVPDVTIETPSVEFGDSDDFGTGWGDGFDSGGGGGMFGSSKPIPGALKGRLYDFKQNRSGKTTDYDPSTKNYARIAGRAENTRFSATAFTSYFQAPKELNLTNLAVPFVSADNGPEYFGAKNTIQPSGWLAVYEGKISAPTNGRYRFRAAADDYLVLLINNQQHLVACWPDLQLEVARGWRPGSQEGSTQSPLGDAQLHAGEWINFTAGQPVSITLAVGERPGGKVGFILEIEKEGETYRTAPNGRKILPLFTTHPFSTYEQKEIKDRFPDYEIEWANVPVFGIK